MRFGKLFTGLMVVLSLALALTLPSAVGAQSSGTRPMATFGSITGGRVGIIFSGICADKRPLESKDDTCDCRREGKCTVNDMVQIFVNVTVLILGISGSVVLLMFVWGGFTWIRSAGNQDLVRQGRETMEHAVIGFAIILLAYSAINFLIASLAGDEPSNSLQGTINNAR
jgi:hypothetical protein